MKKLFIDFLIEEAKFTSLDNKKKQEELLNNTSVNLLWSMVLEKARSQGYELAVNHYASYSKAPDLCYKGEKQS